MSDKPAYVQGLNPLSSHTIRQYQSLYEKQFEALRSVDDGIGSLESERQAEGRA